MWDIVRPSSALTDLFFSSLASYKSHLNKFIVEAQLSSVNFLIRKMNDISDTTET